MSPTTTCSATRVTCSHLALNYFYLCTFQLQDVWLTFGAELFLPVYIPATGCMIYMLAPGCEVDWGCKSGPHPPSFPFSFPTTGRFAVSSLLSYRIVSYGIVFCQKAKAPSGNVLLHFWHAEALPDLMLHWDAAMLATSRAEHAHMTSATVNERRFAGNGRRPLSTITLHGTRQHVPARLPTAHTGRGNGRGYTGNTWQSCIPYTARVDVGGGRSQRDAVVERHRVETYCRDK